jgi:phosphohistidine phosphatase
MFPSAARPDTGVQIIDWGRRWYIYAMRTLYLLRHAKAVEPGSAATMGISDLDRPLTARGRRDAANLADHLRLSGCRPQLVLCSPALRTRQTLDLVATGLGLQARAQVDERVYGASVGELWRVARDLRDEVSEAMIVGHNPGLHELALRLSEHGDDKLRAQVREKFPTCSFVTIAWDQDSWADLRRGAAVLHDFVTPGDL